MKTILLWVHFLMIVSVQAQPRPWMPPAGLVLTAKGTGQTTGHIANISVTNKNDFPISVMEQVFYIPSDGNYQSYVGRIPEDFVVPPGESEDIPVIGVCTDVTRPPVPSDSPMPPIDKWVPVGDPSAPPGSTPGDPPGGSTSPDGNPVRIVWNNPVPRFDPGDIPKITGTPVFTPGKDPGGDIIVTWPGTNIPVGGTLDPRKHPESFAPVVVDAWERIEEAVDDIQQSGFFGTPFTTHPEKERESIVQQTVWIYTAHLTGSEYEKVDFAEKVYDQFEDNSGMAISKLQESQKEELDAGITDFWNTFQATGVEAKIISATSPGITSAGNDSSLIQYQTTTTVEKCECDSLKFKVYIVESGLDRLVQDVTVTKFGGASLEKIKIERTKAQYPNELTIKVSDISVSCKSCGTPSPCRWYTHEKAGTPKAIAEERRNKVRIDDINFGGKNPKDPAPGKKVGDETIGDTNLEITVQPTSVNNSSYYLYFKIAAVCQAPDCYHAICNKDVRIEIKQQ